MKFKPNAELLALTDEFLNKFAALAKAQDTIKSNRTRLGYYMRYTLPEVLTQTDFYKNNGIHDKGIPFGEDEDVMAFNFMIKGLEMNIQDLFQDLKYITDNREYISPDIDFNIVIKKETQQGLSFISKCEKYDHKSLVEVVFSNDGTIFELKLYKGIKVNLRDMILHLQKGVLIPRWDINKMPSGEEMKNEPLEKFISVEHFNRSNIHIMHNFFFNIYEIMANIKENK